MQSEVGPAGAVWRLPSSQTSQCSMGRQGGPSRQSVPYCVRSARQQSCPTDVSIIRLPDLRYEQHVAVATQLSVDFTIIKLLPTGIGYAHLLGQCQAIIQTRQPFSIIELGNPTNNLCFPSKPHKVLLVVSRLAEYRTWLPATLTQTPGMKFTSGPRTTGRPSLGSLSHRRVEPS